MTGRIVRSADFDRVLRTRSRASSAHFAVHHAAIAPTIGRVRSPTPKLSTDTESCLPGPVERLSEEAPSGVWLGAVVPKRHARRAVTRTLLKRQIRSVVDGQGAALANGLWVVRLRAPFDRALFPSAASDALRQQARIELEQLLRQAVLRRPGG